MRCLNYWDQTIKIFEVPNLAHPLLPKKNPLLQVGVYFLTYFLEKVVRIPNNLPQVYLGPVPKKKSPATGWGVFSNLFSGKSRQDNRQGNVAFGNSLSRNTATVSNFNKSPVWDLHTY